MLVSASSWVGLWGAYEVGDKFLDDLDNVMSRTEGAVGSSSRTPLFNRSQRGIRLLTAKFVSELGSQQ